MGPVDSHIVVMKLWVMPCQLAATAVQKLDGPKCRHWKHISTIRSCTQIRTLACNSILINLLNRLKLQSRVKLSQQVEIHTSGSVSS